MQPLTRVTGIAAALPEDDVDTDAIYPARFLLLMNKTGLGRYAFYDRRFAPDGTEIPGFVLNTQPWRNAAILVAGRNFGCGSSREQAVWTLHDFGVRVVIAASFGEIFFANCLQNGVLAIQLPAASLQTVTRAAAAAVAFEVDLPTQRIRTATAEPIGFEVDPGSRDALLNGWDATDMILNRDGGAIASFEMQHRRTHPWLFD
jgi:3-isopropylmalate/(R)-2-methylmalate dehydratase small subunit